MSRQTWKHTERTLAARLGGQRVPVSGRARGDAPDIAHPRLSLEVKHRKSLPAWLREAIEVFSDPRHLPGGTARLAHLAGRSPEHINRVVRAAQGRTATDLINVVRMRWAAAALRMSNRAIGDIAAECGLPHLGHFYETFKQHFRVTPRRYRVDAWQATGHGQNSDDGDES